MSSWRKPAAVILAGFLAGCVDWLWPVQESGCREGPSKPPPQAAVVNDPLAGGGRAQYYPFALNNAGWTVGWASVWKNNQSVDYGFAWNHREGKFLPLRAMDEGFLPADLNDSSWVVGRCLDSELPTGLGPTRDFSPLLVPFIHRQGRACKVHLDSPEEFLILDSRDSISSKATAISPNGTIGGYYTDSGGATIPILYRPEGGVERNLLPAGTPGEVEALSDEWAVVVSRLDPGFPVQWFVSMVDSGVTMGVDDIFHLTDLNQEAGDLGFSGQFSVNVVEIRPDGIALGNVNLPPFGRVFTADLSTGTMSLWPETIVVDTGGWALFNLSGSNASGQVTGTAQPAPEKDSAFMPEPHAFAAKLDGSEFQPLQFPRGVELRIVAGIDDEGTIVGMIEYPIGECNFQSTLAAISP